MRDVTDNLNVTTLAVTQPCRMYVFHQPRRIGSGAVDAVLLAQNDRLTWRDNWNTIFFVAIKKVYFTVHRLAMIMK
jgi:hypothetical protein